MKNVLVTGGSRGIGKAIVEKYKKENYNVYSPSREELNLDDANSIESFIKRNDQGFDIIINNAGLNEINKIESFTDFEMQKMLNVNLIAPLKLIRAFFPHMINNNFGRIINIGSIWAVVSKEGRCIYSATKNAIHGVTNTLALEGANNNILVNTVCPGFTATELTFKNNTLIQIEEIEKTIPVNRMAKPEEIASLVYYFGSENNTYVTGQKIVVDGGFSIQ